jgi:hypothetical protein
MYFRHAANRFHARYASRSRLKSRPTSVPASICDLVVMP